MESGVGKTDATNNILICFIMGENAEYMSSIDAGAVDVALAELDLLFGGAASLYYLESSIQDWSLEPFIKGAYSFPSPGTYISETQSSRLDLASPVDCVLFLRERQPIIIILPLFMEHWKVVRGLQRRYWNALFR